MDARSVKSAADAQALIEERGLSHVKLGIVDLDGVIRGKYLARDKFVGALESGFAFCDIVFGWDSDDQMYDQCAFTGWHTAFPDATARIDPATCRDVPTEENMLFFLGEFEGEAAKLCPRRLLRRVIDRAETMGLHPSVAAEFEFFVFDLPQGATVTAWNTMCEVQAAEIRFGGGIFWGVQYHPEYRLHDIAAVIRRYGQTLVDEGFFADLGALAQYAADLSALDADGERSDVAWKFVLNREVLNDDCRQTELKNWIASLERT